MQPPVTVVRASAGSGKTHRLTQDYIQLLLEGDPQRYKHILAVTFTNKATDEMKSRVVEELYKLSRSNDAQAPLAADRLRRMLHDYSCFSVSTIDKFFQTVMRAFAREIGQYASYRVELDDEAVITQVVDLMLESMDDPANAALLDWLRDYSFDRVEQGAEAWRRGDLETYGRLSFESGQSSISNWETGSPELKMLYDIMRHTDGIYGGRFSGAGFKGCCMALIDPAYEAAITRQVTKEYLAAFPQLEGKYSVHICESADGL